MVKVRERKLGREGADGLAYLGKNKIEIDPRLGPKERLFTLVHEGHHIAHDDDSEVAATKSEKIIGQILWDDGWRRVPKRFR